jgi:hypothetical protein
MKKIKLLLYQQKMLDRLLIIQQQFIPAEKQKALNDDHSGPSD